MAEIFPGWQAHTRRFNEWLCVALQPPAELALASGPLAEAIWALRSAESATNLVIDMGDVAYVSSWMVGQLVVLHRRLSVQGHLLRLAALSPGAQTVLKVMNLYERFPSYANVDDAIAGRLSVAATP